MHFNDFQSEERMNGKPWLPEHDSVLKSWAGKIPDAEIGRKTGGHSERKVCERRNELDLPAFHPQRASWSRRDYLLAAGAGMMVPC